LSEPSGNGTWSPVRLRIWSGGSGCATAAAPPRGRRAPAPGRAPASPGRSGRCRPRNRAAGHPSAADPRGAASRGELPLAGVIPVGGFHLFQVGVFLGIHADWQTKVVRRNGTCPYCLSNPPSGSRLRFTRSFFAPSGLTCLALLLALGHAALATLAMREKSTTADELAHVTGGYTFNRWHDYRLQPENGNLPQRWQTLPRPGAEPTTLLQLPGLAQIRGLARRLTIFSTGVATIPRGCFSPPAR